ncbi:hypothetical protein R6Q59_029504 [Mikania micrantha]
MEVDDFHNDYEYENMDDTVHTKNLDAEMIDHDNLQQQIRHPDNEKATGAPKKVRSHTQKAEIWKMVSNERILVMFHKFGKPVGDEGKELVQYIGTLVRMPEHVSIEHSDWRKVPMQQKEDMYSLVKSKFSFHQGETSQIKKWIMHSMGKTWRTWKGVLKSRGYDPSLTIDEIVAQQINNDDRVNPIQFKELNTCAKKRSSRSKMKEPHVTGKKSLARLAHEVAMKNDGVYPTRGEMYIKTRTRKDGSVVDDEAASVVASLKAIASDSTSTPGDRDDFTRDDYSKVKGPEKRGYVQLVERMPATKDKAVEAAACRGSTLLNLEGGIVGLEGWSWTLVWLLEHVWELEEWKLIDKLKHVDHLNFRRMELAKHFIRTNIEPKWMVLCLLPVLPPELRPIYHTDEDKLVTSDINEIYRRIIYRNNTLTDLLTTSIATPEELIISQEKLLQEAVDALLDNGICGPSMTDDHNRIYKSLSDVIDGKEGRVRETLLGKRVDYSGRSLIVMGPSLSLHRCGLPREIAIERLQAFVIRDLIRNIMLQT